MTEFMKHVFPMFLRPFRPSCLMAGATEARLSSSPSRLSLSSELRSRKMLLGVEAVAEVPGCDRTFRFSLGDVEMS